MSLGKDVIVVTKFEKLYNSQVLATLVHDCYTFNKRITKEMMTSILPKEWEQNKNVRKKFVASILTWHHAKYFSNM